MTGYTHLVGGIASLTLPVALLQVLGGGIPPDMRGGGLAAGTLFGSLAPDVDAPQSLLKSFTLPLNGTACRKNGLDLTPFALPATLLQTTLGHRTWLHSLPGTVPATAFVALPLALCLEPGLGMGFILGYLSHLALDACTVHGIPLLYPSRRRFHLLSPSWRIATGSPQEEIAFALLASVAFAVLVSLSR